MAQAAAANSTYRHRLGAVIVCGGRVRGVGWSKRRNEPARVSEEHVQMCSVHAEVDALRGLSVLRRGTAFVVRLDAFDRPALAKPCGSCMLALGAAGVTTVFWSADHQRVGVAKVWS